MDDKKIIFITGTDTGVGKTLLTALLLHHLRVCGMQALAMKPFCSGGRADIRLLQSLQPGALTDAQMNPFYFAKPVAPLVAQKGRHGIGLREVLKKIRRIRDKCDHLLVEGSGGLLVPLGPALMVADLITSLDCSVIIVARNRLGTINHTLLTVEALRHRGVKQRGLSVVLMSQPAKDVSQRSNREVLAKLLKPVPVLEIPFLGKRISDADAIRRGQKKIGRTLGRLAGTSRIGLRGLTQAAFP